jgi:hypothetical protein
VGRTLDFVSRALSSGEESEGLLNASGDCRVVAEGLVELEDDGGRIGEFLQNLRGGGPIDGAVAGPEMLVFLAMVVMNMDGGDACAEGSDGIAYTDSDVCVAEV